MGTYYELNSSFRVLEMKKDVAGEKVKEFFEHWDGVYLETLDGGALQLVVEVHDYMSYSSASNLDSMLFTAAQELADFSDGPVTAQSSGEEYADGPYDWCIGPEKAALGLHLAWVESKIGQLEKEKAQLQERIACADNEIISTLGGWGVPKGE